MQESVSAVLFTILTGMVIIFQGCLAAGMPWGSASMGGRYPGKYPPKMRVVALINVGLLCFTILIVLSRADILFPQLKQMSRIGIWFVVVFFSIGTVLNTITPSKIERIWAPVAFIQLVSSILVAMS